MAARSLNRPAPTATDNVETSGFETHLLECCLFVDDYLQSHPKVADWRWAMGSDPDFTDAEMVMIILREATSGPIRRERTYELVMANAERAFPSRAEYKQWAGHKQWMYKQWMYKQWMYKQWIRRLKRLLGQVGQLAWAAALRGLTGEGRTGEGRKLYAADSLPIPLCEAARHGRARLLDEDGAKFGVDASGDWFYGFKIHALIHRPTQIVITAIVITAQCSCPETEAIRSPPADWPSRQVGVFFWLMRDTKDVSSLTGRAARPKRFAQVPSDGSGEGHSAVSRASRQGESSFSGLWRRFSNRAYARSWHGP